MLAELYARLQAPLIRTDLKTAEMVKYVDNGWHALKIGFANEIGNLCKAFDVDAHEVMNIFCQDRNSISPPPTYAGICFRRVLSAQGSARLGLSGKAAAICNCRFSLPSCPATKCRSRGVLQLILETGNRKSACSGSASRPARTTCARVP